jgi:very-short-patch-repair endonuclease
MICFQKSTHLERDTQAFEKNQWLKIKIENLEGLQFEEIFYKD